MYPGYTAATSNVRCTSRAIDESSLRSLYLTRPQLNFGVSAQKPCQRAVIWYHADVLSVELPAAAFDVWHDRAVFHFFTDAADRARYVAQVRHAIRPGGFALVATFAEDGPTRCSGLDVARYSPETLHNEFGNDFLLVESRREEHSTPWGASQIFTYCLCRYDPQALLRHAA